MSRSFSGIGRKLEEEMETVVKVLQPGPLAIIEHKFSAQEIQEANATVRRPVANCRLNAKIDQKNDFLKELHSLDKERLSNHFPMVELFLVLNIRNDNKFFEQENRAFFPASCLPPF